MLFNTSVIENYGHYPANFSLSDEENNMYLSARNTAHSWFFMRTPWPVLSITGAYLIFVTKLGPQLMKNRKPFDLQKVIAMYNLYQMVSNMYLVSMLVTTEGSLRYLLNHACYPLEPAKNPYWFAGFEGAYCYLISKLCDLNDTVFFILRKKQSHVTFLHVYHHTNMVLSTWYLVKYTPGEQLVIVGMLNSLVHVAMYSYYFLAALGPQFRKYLWWKVYVTRLQMVQFVIYILYMGGLILLRCDLPVSLSYYIIFQGGVFLALFANFYMKTYSKLSPSQPRKPVSQHSIMDGSSKLKVT